MTTPAGAATSATAYATAYATVRTTCPYCGVGCGVVATRKQGKVMIAGDTTHSANQGRLCSKGSALAETLGPEDRLLFPSIRGVRASWNEALTHVADGFARIVREHGRDAVAFYVSGQLLTEDYYVANKLMKGFIGTANIDTNSRLCMASAVAGHKRAFGADIVPGCYEDLELADLIVLVGSNTAWCHPILFQRIVRARELRPGLRIVVIDPRRTPTCEIAALHLPVRAGSDVWLFAGLLSYLHQHGHVDTAYVARHTANASEALAVAHSQAGDVSAVAAACGVEVARIQEFYELFARTERVVTAFSQGVNQSSSGTDKVNSIINCHLFTGRIGRPGMGPFSITGQPNAMGGREAGGMANMLAAHMDVTNSEHQATVRAFWNSPTIATRPGYKAVDLFDAIHDGRIKAVWIVATNPVVSLPEADRVREALQRCEMVVVSDCVASTDTMAFAHVLLPASSWGEKDGTVTNSERRISRQRAFLSPPGEAKPDWWIFCEVARRMGFAAAFDYETPGDIFVEHAALSGFRNYGTRAFNIAGLAGLSREQYEALEPIQWPVPANGNGTARLGVDGVFYHPDGKARFVATPPRGPTNKPDEDFPLVLNTGRIRDQWHTMTRTGRAPRLSDHLAEPFADMHAQDALHAGVRDGELARVTTRWGAVVARVRSSGEIARGSVFVPIHWSAANSSDARVGAIVNPSVDAISGEPEFKHTPARVEPLPVEWYGVLYVRDPPDTAKAPDTTWWTRVRGDGFLRYELAGREKLFVPSSDARHNRESWTRKLLGAQPDDATYIDYEDSASGLYRAASIAGDRIVSCMFLSTRPQLPSREWLAGLLTKKRIDDNDRRGLLAGRPLTAAATDTGPLVCSCFRVGRSTISEAIVCHGLKTAAQVGARLKAGTNCGSCLPEISALLSSAATVTS
ncbi:MAG: molybdopterin-dependent oxidoreductase [Gammaproteobacteria bacterium]